jgi:hypothetical protein
MTKYSLILFACFLSYAISGDLLVRECVDSSVADDFIKLSYIFKTFDIRPKNDFLDFYECELFQRLTDITGGGLPLTWNIWKEITRMVGSNERIGLDMVSLNKTYTTFQHILGTNLDRDWNIVKGMEGIRVM